MIEMVFSHKLFNPLFWHIRKAMHDKNIRYIINRGGSSSGKSVSTTQAVLLSVFSCEGSALVVRKVGASLRNTVYEEFKTQLKALQLNYGLTMWNSTVKRIMERLRIAGRMVPNQ